MAFYLFKARYSRAAVKAMVSEPQDRADAARQIIEAMGGKLHHFFFALGDWDAIAIVEGPDDKMMVAGSLVVSASGTISDASTTKLMTADEAMEAMTMAKGAVDAYKSVT